jgi:IS5 family transposase
MNEAFHEITSMRLFADLSLDSSISEYTTIINYMHLLEKHKLSRQFFKEVNLYSNLPQRRHHCGRNYY